MPAPGRDSAELRFRAQRRWRSPLRWRCVYCGRVSQRMQVDHFVPLALGGTGRASNLVPACPDCNSEKSDHPPVEWMTAVGVPTWWIIRLQEITLDPTWRAPMYFDPPTNKLEYALGRAV